MLKPELPETQQSLAVRPEGQQVVLAEDGDNPLALILPPVEDLAEIDSLRGKHLSLAISTSRDSISREAEFAIELVELKRKIEQFKDSPTYWNRLASLAVLAGNRDEEASYLDSARKVSSDVLFVHKYGDNLLARGKDAESEKLFSNMDLRRDLQANLKLAYFHARRSEYEKSSTYVTNALSIDPLSFAARLFEGGLALVSGEFEQALHSFRIAADERSNSAALFSNMGIAYIRLGLFDKALTVLKRATALDPLNAQVISTLADLSFELKRNEESVPSLRYYVEFEQTNIGIWGRLARACLEIGCGEEAIAALKRQASLQNSSSVWNNLGVAYQLCKQPAKSLQAFKHGMVLGENNKGRGYLFAARNLAQSLLSSKLYRELIQFSRAVLDDDPRRLTSTHYPISDLNVFYILGLQRMREHAEATLESRRLLSIPDLSRPLAIWLTANLVASYVLVDDDISLAMQLIDANRNWIDGISVAQDKGSWALFNNVAFALAEAGRLQDAERYLARIGALVHKDPYATATLGLLNVRQGHIERGIDRYKEAITLATEYDDKARIRQKMNLEIGLFFLPNDPVKARRFLERASSEKSGEYVLNKKASSQLAILRLQNK